MLSDEAVLWSSVHQLVCEAVLVGTPQARNITTRILDTIEEKLKAEAFDSGERVACHKCFNMVPYLSRETCWCFRCGVQLNRPTRSSALRDDPVLKGKLRDILGAQYPEPACLSLILDALEQSEQYQRAMEARVALINLAAPCADVGDYTERCQICTAPIIDCNKTFCSGASIRRILARK